MRHFQEENKFVDIPVDVFSIRRRLRQNWQKQSLRDKRRRTEGAEKCRGALLTVGEAKVSLLLLA